MLLTTMLSEPGALERLLGLEARIQAKVKAAGVYGMESEVNEGRTIEAELYAYAGRLAGGDPGLLDDAEAQTGAFVGEQLRRLVERAIREGEVARVSRLPWGVGAAFRQRASGRAGAPGVLFAMRTPAMPADEAGLRYWRYVESESGALVANDLEILRRIDPSGGAALASDVELDLEHAWRPAAADAVAAHNARADLRALEEPVGPPQRWALDILRDPGVAYVPGADEAEQALSVGRGSTVRSALGEIESAVAAGSVTLDAAAVRVVGVVEEFGLRAVEPAPLPRAITVDELGVVCWMAVLPETRGAPHPRRGGEPALGRRREVVLEEDEPPRGAAEMGSSIRPS